jgi:tetratricopeptide (TPR) repeat protein
MTSYGDKKVTYTEYAEYSLGILAYRGEKRDLEPLKSFIKKYPESPMLKNAYMYVSLYYMSLGSKEEAGKFFEEYVAKFPDDPNVLNYYVTRIIRDKEPLERGIQLAEKIRDMMKFNPDPRFIKNLAQLYILKGEPEKAENLYGNNFMEGRVSMLGMALMDYANFWVQQNKNTDSAVAMAEMAVRLNPEMWYTIQSLAQVYLKLNKEDKALEVYGPAYVKKYWDKSVNVRSYAGFWTRQGKNLESALGAAKRAIELTPDAYAWDTLAQTFLKLKRYDEALKAEEKAVALAEGPSAESFKKKIEQIKKAMAEEKK